MSALRHGPPLAMNGYMDKEGRKFRARKTRYFKLKDSALFNHRRKDSVRCLPSPPCVAASARPSPHFPY